MRLALVYKRLSLHGGSERQVTMLARDLAQAGHEVHVFCRNVRTEPPPGVTLHRMPSLPLGPLGELFLFSPWAQRAVRREERRSGPFDVRQAFGRTLGQDIYRVGGGCHRTYLEHAHALERPYWLRRWLTRGPLQRLRMHIEKRVLHGPPQPYIIANSRMAREDLLDRYDLDPTRVRLVANGVDKHNFRPPSQEERAALRVEWNLGPDDPVVLFLGTGYARKGLDATLRAMACLPSDVKLLVVGRDHRAGRWRTRARQLGVDRRVTWLGSRDDPQRCYRAADVYALPSTYDPASNSVLEALASGLPVVTSSMNGASEVIEPGVHGSVLTTPVVPEELAAALHHWLAVGDRQGLARRTRALVEEDVRSSMRCTLDVYSTFLQDRDGHLGDS